MQYVSTNIAMIRERRRIGDVRVEPDRHVPRSRAQHLFIRALCNILTSCNMNGRWAPGKQAHEHERLDIVFSGLQLPVM